MFEESFAGLADLVLPGTSYLERDGTTLNLEGRLQRQRRSVIAPCPDELAWIAKLAERFGVELSPYASTVFDEISAACYGGITLAELGEHAPLPPRAAAPASVPKPEPRKAPAGKGLRLLTYRPLFSGPGGRAHARARVPDGRTARSSSRPPTRARAGSRQATRSRSARTAPRGTLRARIAFDLAPGSVRVAARSDAEGLHELRSR